MQVFCIQSIWIVLGITRFQDTCTPFYRKGTRSSSSGRQETINLYADHLYDVWSREVWDRLSRISKLEVISHLFIPIKSEHSVNERT